MAYSIIEKQKELNKIFDHMSNGLSLRSAVTQKNVKISTKVFLQWVSNSDEYSLQYARAIADRGVFLFEETMSIADNDNDCTFTDLNGVERVDTGAIQNKRLKIDTRKWFLSKLLPKKYADRLQIDATVTDTTNKGFDISLLKPDTLALIERDLTSNKALSSSIPPEDIQDAEEITDK